MTALSRPPPLARAAPRAALWRQMPLGFRIGAAILAVHLVVAGTGPFWAPHGYAELGAGPPLSGATWAHPFGIDQLGRDVFSRVVRGGWIVLALALTGTLLGMAVGTVLGLVSGYKGGWFDLVVQRLLEALISIPFLVLALVAISAVGVRASGNPLVVVAAVAIVYAPRVARLARAAAIEIAGRDHVAAARLRGEGAWTIMRHELLPNASGVLLVEFALRAGYAPVLIGSLGFLGFGVRAPLPEWGLMISENRALLLVAPATVLGPGLALASLVVGLNLVTEGVARVLGRTVRLGAE